MTIEDLIQMHVTNLVDDIKKQLQAQFDGVSRKAIRGAITARRSDEQMRCRYTVNGRPCKERSRGPRFHFLCTEHSEKAAEKAAKKASKKTPKKAAKKVTKAPNKAPNKVPVKETSVAAVPVN